MISMSYSIISTNGYHPSFIDYTAFLSIAYTPSTSKTSHFRHKTALSPKFLTKLPSSRIISLTHSLAPSTSLLPNFLLILPSTVSSIYLTSSTLDYPVKTT